LKEDPKSLPHELNGKAGNRITTQTGIGTSIAIAGIALYSFMKAKVEGMYVIIYY
jgi:hypothetical protein